MKSILPRRWAVLVVFGIIYFPALAASENQLVSWIGILGFLVVLFVGTFLAVKLLFSRKAKKQ